MRYLNVKIDILHFLGSLLCFAIAIGLAAGKVQEYIHFAGELNELAEFILAGTMGILLLISSIEFKKEENGK